MLESVKKYNIEEFNVQNREISSATFINRVSRAKNCNIQQPNKMDH